NGSRARSRSSGWRRRRASSSSATGENLVGLCPFHDDREPSLVITPSKNLWHCLGACQAGGTVIDWVMRAEGVRFRHAVELLREGLPSLDAFPQKPRGRQQGKVAKQTTTPKLPVLLERSADNDVLPARCTATARAGPSLPPGPMAAVPGGAGWLPPHPTRNDCPAGPTPAGPFCGLCPGGGVRRAPARGDV